MEAKIDVEQNFPGVVCNGCNNVRNVTIDVECISCAKHYNLCIKCQPKYPAICPFGTGCRKF